MVRVDPSFDVRELFAPRVVLPHTISPSPWPLSRCRIMAAVNQNMFDASITIDRPRGASLMVLPLNLIAQIVTNVSSPTRESPTSKLLT